MLIARAQKGSTHGLKICTQKISRISLCHCQLSISCTFGGPVENFLCRGDEVGEGDVTLISHFNREVYELLCQEFGVREFFSLYETNMVNINNIEYRNGQILVIKMDEFGHPTFASIGNIFVVDNTKYFLINKLAANCYIWRFHSYSVQYTDIVKLLKWNKLRNKFPLHTFEFKNLKLVMNCYSEYTGFLF